MGRRNRSAVGLEKRFAYRSLGEELTQARIAHHARERNGVILGRSPGFRRLRRTGTFEGVGAQCTDLEAVLAALQVLDSSERGGCDQGRSMDLAKVYAGPCFNCHCVEMKCHECHLLAAPSRLDCMLHGLLRQPTCAAEKRPADPLCPSAVSVLGAA